MLQWPCLSSNIMRVGLCMEVLFYVLYHKRQIILSLHFNWTAIYAFMSDNLTNVFWKLRHINKYIYIYIGALFGN